MEFGPFRSESLRRFRQFMVFAGVIASIGLVLQLLGVSAWPVAFYGAGAFVVSQALLKWNDSRWAICPRCDERFHYYGRVPPGVRRGAGRGGHDS